MTYIEEQNDLFDYAGKAWLAQCISADFAMGKGIATQFNKRFDLKNYIIKNFEKNKWNSKGYCIPVEDYKVFNLVTKEHFYEKPSYRTLNQSLIDMKNYIVKNNIKTLAIPQLGCGLDCLFYGNVKNIIIDRFQDIDITIIVCIK